jgi:cytoskeleton protein RodZ
MKAGVHLAILSVNMKVSIKQLEALESDRFDLLSGTVFSRALAAKVCRFLNMDPQPVLSLMPVNSNGLKPLNIIDAEQAPTYASHRSAQRRSGMGRGLKLWVLILLIGLLTFSLGGDWIVQFVQMESAPQAAEVVPIMPPVQEPVLPDAAQAELPKAMVFESPNTESTPATSKVPTPVNVSTENLK